MILRRVPVLERIRLRRKARQAARRKARKLAAAISAVAVPEALPPVDTATAKVLDKYYTRPEVARLCVSIFKEFVPPDAVFLEPSAGAGAFLDAVASTGSTIFGADIAPERSDIVQHDFLEPGLIEKLRLSSEQRTRLAVIGNPPFGKHSSLVTEFINRAFEIADTVGFIVGVGLGYYSAQSRVRPDARLVADILLPVDGYRLDGRKARVVTRFQVWTTRAPAIGEFTYSGDFTSSGKGRLRQRVSTNMRRLKPNPVECADMSLKRYDHTDGKEPPAFTLAVPFVRSNTYYDNITTDAASLVPGFRYWLISAKIDPALLLRRLLQIPLLNVAHRHHHRGETYVGVDIVEAYEQVAARGGDAANENTSWATYDMARRKRRPRNLAA